MNQSTFRIWKILEVIWRISALCYMDACRALYYIKQIDLKINEIELNRGLIQS